MSFMKKNKGFSLLELIVTLGLFSIFSLIVFPLLRVSHSLNTAIIKQSLLEKDEVKIISLIEDCIESSNILKSEYSGKEYIKNGVAILNHEQVIELVLKENFFKCVSQKGNTLFLEYPVSDGNTIFYTFIIFQFFAGELIILECKESFNDIVVENSSIVLKKVYGSFEKTETGVIINLNISNSDFSETRSLKGYANFKKEI